MMQIYAWREAEAPWLGHLSPLFAATCGALALVMLGGVLLARAPRLGRALRFGGNLLLITVFALAVLRFVRTDPSFDAALHAVGAQPQTVEGGETRIPLGPDGHYWINARINGTRLRLMVDTGATVTAISQDVAGAAGIKPDPLGPEARVETANGTVSAEPARIDSLRFGSIAARDLGAIVMPGRDGPNVLGMNFLTRLKGWRVEEGVLILTPHQPKPDADAPEPGSRRSAT
jgi:aspartyl protease family protein